MEYHWKSGKVCNDACSTDVSVGFCKRQKKETKLPESGGQKHTERAVPGLLAYANLVPDNSLFNRSFKKISTYLKNRKKKNGKTRKLHCGRHLSVTCHVLRSNNQIRNRQSRWKRAVPCRTEDVLPEYK